ncbi:MAG TPA: ABC transporter permease, partial [Acidimicrobiales bacterium]|nr:ABC transporter permease [Acidimicrobiales bacterium]
LGFRFHNSTPAAVAAILVALTLGLAFSWVCALIGLSVRSAETAQVATLLLVIPLAFTSSMFVPVATMPGWLPAFARINPSTRAVDALRALCLPHTSHGPAFAWIAAILAVTIPPRWSAATTSPDQPMTNRTPHTQLVARRRLPGRRPTEHHDEL